MQKFWGLFFALVLSAILALCLVSPFIGWWMPQNIASYGGEVDNLFNIILAITGVVFVLTEAMLCWFMFRYAYDPRRKARYVEGNHRLELVWTAVPAVILVWIAFAQVSLWERIKYQGLMPEPDEVVQVTAHQWEWRMRYTLDKKSDAEGRAWAEAPEIDDVHIPNELHTWAGAKVRVYLKTRDVIHSFALPNLRLMQDILPGKTLSMWFMINKDGVNTQWNEAAGRCTEPTLPSGEIDHARQWEIACKQLCGGGHYRMRGRIYVHPDEEDFRAWLRYQLKAQNSHEPERSPDAAETPVASNTQ